MVILFGIQILPNVCHIVLIIPYGPFEREEVIIKGEQLKSNSQTNWFVTFNNGSLPFRWAFQYYDQFEQLGVRSIGVLVLFDA